MVLGLSISDLHSHPCHHQLAGDCERHRGACRHVSLKPDAGMDCLLPAYHHPDQRYRVSVSDTRLHAGHRHWHYFNGIAWSGGLRAVFKASSGGLAMDLRLHSYSSTLPQCIRVDCAIIPENSRSQPAGANSIRTALRDCASVRAICFCGVRHDRGPEISSGRDFQPLTEGVQIRRVGISQSYAYASSGLSM